MAEKDYNKQEKAEKTPTVKFGSGTGSGKPKFSIYWLYLSIAIFLGVMWFTSGNKVSQEVPYSEFRQFVEGGYFEKITVTKNTGIVTADLVKDPTPINPTLGELYKNQGKEKEAGEPGPSKMQLAVRSAIPSNDRIAEDLEQWKSADSSQCKDLVVTYTTDSDWLDSFLVYGGPFLLIILFYVFMFRRMGGSGSGGGMGIFNVGKSRATVYEKENKMPVTFENVAGLSEAKQEVQEIVEFLKNPQKYTAVGGKIPKGALLVGPPGTGKTLLAKAVAGEAGVPFFSMSGSDFVEMFVGVGASRVRDLFRQAKEKAPSIVFIDEIDAVGRARGNRQMQGGNDERENTLNQLLTEMDGFGTNSGVIILAATNRADILDKALLRAGRFDRQIHVDLPEIKDRVEIFKVHLKPIKLAEELDIKKLARQTPGFSGADIANVCNEAALIAARHNKEKVEASDFNLAIDRIIGGLEKKSKVLTAEEKHSIAIHEAGHATISWHLRYAAPLVKVTIVPRGNALGAAWYMPEERQITTEQAMLDELCSLLGGRAAEELFIGSVSSGAANDLERVTKQAYAMIVYYGMSKRLPNICYYDSTGQDYGFQKPYSDERARIIDEEVSALIASQYARAKEVLSQYAEGHAKLTQTLEEREVIFTEDVQEIFGARQWTSRNDILENESEEGDASASSATENNENENNHE